MDYPHALNGHLGALTDALDDPGTDLQAVLSVLVDDLTAAVPSFLGLTMTLHLGGDPITLTTIDADLAGAAGASLQLPLDRLAGAGAMVVFYAGKAGAFVDLAADTRHAYGLAGRVVLDGHLTPTPGPPTPPGVSGLDELSVINQAIGVLIDQGRPPEQAHDELLRRATHHRYLLPTAARHLLTAAARTDPPPQADS